MASKNKKKTLARHRPKNFNTPDSKKEFRVYLKGVHEDNEAAKKAVAAAAAKATAQKLAGATDQTNSSSSDDIDIKDNAQSEKGDINADEGVAIDARVVLTPEAKIKTIHDMIAQVESEERRKAAEFEAAQREQRFSVQKEQWFCTKGAISKQATLNADYFTLTTQWDFWNDVIRTLYVDMKSQLERDARTFALEDLEATITTRRPFDEKWHSYEYVTSTLNCTLPELNLHGIIRDLSADWESFLGLAKNKLKARIVEAHNKKQYDDALELNKKRFDVSVEPNKEQEMNKSVISSPASNKLFGTLTLKTPKSKTFTPFPTSFSPEININFAPHGFRAKPPFIDGTPCKARETAFSSANIKSADEQLVNIRGSSFKIPSVSFGGAAPLLTFGKKPAAPVAELTVSADPVDVHSPADVPLPEGPIAADEAPADQISVVETPTSEDEVSIVKVPAEVSVLETPIAIADDNNDHDSDNAVVPEDNTTNTEIVATDIPQHDIATTEIVATEIGEPVQESPAISPEPTDAANSIEEVPEVVSTTKDTTPTPADEVTQQLAEVATSDYGFVGLSPGAKWAHEVDDMDPVIWQSGIDSSPPSFEDFPPLSPLQLETGLAQFHEDDPDEGDADGGACEAVIEVVADPSEDGLDLEQLFPEAVTEVTVEIVDAGTDELVIEIASEVAAEVLSNGPAKLPIAVTDDSAEDDELVATEHDLKEEKTLETVIGKDDSQDPTEQEGDTPAHVVDDNATSETDKIPQDNILILTESPDNAADPSDLDITDIADIVVADDVETATEISIAHDCAETQEVNNMPLAINNDTSNPSGHGAVYEDLFAELIAAYIHLRSDQESSATPVVGSASESTDTDHHSSTDDGDASDCETSLPTTQATSPTLGAFVVTFADFDDNMAEGYMLQGYRGDLVQDNADQDDDNEILFPQVDEPTNENDGLEIDDDMAEDCMLQGYTGDHVPDDADPDDDDQFSCPRIDETSNDNDECDNGDTEQQDLDALFVTITDDCFESVEGTSHDIIDLPDNEFEWDSSDTDHQIIVTLPISTDNDSSELTEGLAHEAPSSSDPQDLAASPVSLPLDHSAPIEGFAHESDIPDTTNVTTHALPTHNFAPRIPELKLKLAPLGKLFNQHPLFEKSDDFGLSTFPLLAQVEDGESLLNTTNCGSRNILGIQFDSGFSGLDFDPGNFEFTGLVASRAQEVELLTTPTTFPSIADLDIGDCQTCPFDSLYPPRQPIVINMSPSAERILANDYAIGLDFFQVAAHNHC